MLKAALALGLVASAAGGAVSLTTEASFDEAISGKNAIIKFQAPW
jgi:hypothetical protein